MYLILQTDHSGIVLIHMILLNKVSASVLTRKAVVKCIERGLWRAGIIGKGLPLVTFLFVVTKHLPPPPREAA